eukprot:157861_1
MSGETSDDEDSSSSYALSSGSSTNSDESTIMYHADEISNKKVISYWIRTLNVRKTPSDVVFALSNFCQSPNVEFRKIGLSGNTITGIKGDLYPYGKSATYLSDWLSSIYWDSNIWVKGTSTSSNMTMEKMKKLNEYELIEWIHDQIDNWLLYEIHEAIMYQSLKYGQWNEVNRNQAILHAMSMVDDNDIMDDKWQLIIQCSFQDCVPSKNARFAMSHNCIAACDQSNFILFWIN